MAGKKISLDLFANYATTEVGLPVVNKTGLTGRYDFTLEFAPSRVGAVSVTEQPEPLGTPFQDAIQQQLGLKLIRAKAPVTTYHLDYVEKPTEN
jgi:uncharacterized protein (TIGR03435 family)